MSSITPNTYWPGQFVPFEGNDQRPDANDMSTLHQLCEKCTEFRSWFKGTQERNKVVEHRPKDISEKYLHMSFPALKANADSGCHLCSLFLAGCLMNLKPSDLAPKFSVESLEVVVVSLERTPLVLTSHSDYLWIHSIEEELKEPSTTHLFADAQLSTLFGLKIQLPPKRLPYLPLSRYTASVESQNWAKSQLLRCLKHSRCGFREKHEFVPRRLLDVSSVIKNDLVRMVYTTKRDFQSKYTTLSYCWGGDQAFKLTQATHDELKVGIPCDRLQKSIHDAIRITIGLDIKYIWVDALCIRQDDPDDWDHESKLMSEIYQNSTLTISAQGAEGSLKGCFAARNLLMHHPCRLSEENAEGKSLMVYPERRTATRRKLAFENAPLFKRAWVFQERMLSPRNLFLGEVLSWQCNELSTSEITEGVGEEYTNPKALLPLEPSAYVMTGVAPPDDSVSRFWTFLMAKYPASDISLASDRPIAVRGIMKYLEDLTGYENIYGLWTRFLASEMLWQVNEPSVHETKSQCPTWSWLRMTTSVVNNCEKFEGKDIICHVSVLEKGSNLSYVHKPLSFFAKQLSPKTALRIKGVMLPVTSFTNEGIECHYLSHKVDYFPDVEGPYPTQQIYFLLVARQGRKSPYIMGFYYGLAVCASRTIKGAYERIGYLESGHSLRSYTQWVEEDIVLV